jgi:hypothetical protein
MDNCYNLNGPLFISSVSRKINNCYHTDESSTIGTVIAKEDMIGINALDNMPLLDSNAVEPSDNIITLPYDNLPVGEWKSSSTDEGASISVEALQDGTIIWGVGNGIQIDNPFEATEQAKYKIATIPDYDPSTCELIIEELLEWPEGYEAPGSCTVAFASIYMEGNELWIRTSIGLIGDGMPNQYGGYKVKIKRTGSPAAYINDYTYPHLTSFVEGWKCIDRDIEIPECEVTQEELDEVKNEVKELSDTVANTKCEVSKQDLSNGISESKKYTDLEIKKTNDFLYKEVKLTDNAKIKDIINGMAGTKCKFKFYGGQATAWGNDMKHPVITSRNIALLNSLITASGYTKDGITYTLCTDGGIKITGMANSSGEFDISDDFMHGWGPDIYRIVGTDFSDSKLLSLVSYINPNFDGNLIVNNNYILTKDGIKPAFADSYSIKFYYTEGIEYNNIVYPQVEFSDITKADYFIPYERYEYTTIEEFYDEESHYIETNLIGGTYEFIIPKTGDYVIRPSCGVIDFTELEYSAFGDYGMNIITDLQSQIDELKQALSSVNSILDTLVEGSAE